MLSFAFLMRALVVSTPESYKAFIVSMIFALLSTSMSMLSLRSPR